MPRRNRALDRAAAAGTRGRWTSACWATGTSGPVLGGDRSRGIKRRRCRGGGCLAEHWCPVVPQGWRDAASQPRAGVWALSVLRRSGRRSRSCSLVVVGCGRSRVSWVVRRRRSPESCNGTLRSAPAGLSIGPRPRRRMPTVALDDRSRRSSRSTRSCVRYVQDRLAGAVQRPDGSVAGPQVGWRWAASRTAKGPALGTVVGARSRSPVDCALTSPMMSRCVFPMRRSISRSMCRAAERCAGS